MFHFPFAASIKQYKGKRDPAAVPVRAYVASVKPLANDVQIIDLSKSSEHNSPGSTATVCSDDDDVDDMSDTRVTDNTSSASRSGANGMASNLSPKPDRQRSLLRSAVEQFERSVPCMTTLDRVKFWQVADQLDEMAEFSSDKNESMVL